MLVIPMCGDSPSLPVAFNRRDSCLSRVSVSGTYDLRQSFQRTRCG